MAQNRNYGLVLAFNCSVVLAACNGTSSTTSASGGGQALTGAAVQAQASTALFSNNGCISGKFNFSGQSTWYISGSVDIINTCSSDQDLTNQVVSFTSQDMAGKVIPVGTINNWWLNDTSYQLNFRAGNGNQQLGTFSSGNGKNLIKAQQTITFSGGLNLFGTAYDFTTAQQTFTINGSVPPAPTTGTLNVIVDTQNAGCSGNSSCSGLTVNVSDSLGTKVASFVVLTTALGGTYTQPITNLTANNNYTVSGSNISGTSVSYAPNASVKVESGAASMVTVKYDKLVPQVATGKLTLSLVKLVPAYKGDLQVQILNKQNGSQIVNSYTLRQGTTVTTESLPISDSTHQYQIKLVTGIADPQQGLYYIESGLPIVTIIKDQTTPFAVPLTASSATKRKLTLNISGLQANDTAQLVFSDGGGQYSYVSYSGLSNGSTTYQVEESSVLATSVLASSNNYQLNPINTTRTISGDSNLAVAFQVPVPVSGASYDYIAPFKDYNNKVVLSLQGLSRAKSLTFTSNFQPSVGWGSCFGQSVYNLNFATKAAGSKFVTTVTPQATTVSLDLTKSCDIMGTNSGDAVVLPGVADPIISAVNVDGKLVAMNQPCAATQCQDPGHGYVNAGYYAQWAVWGRQYDPYTIPFNNINDVIYAFVGFNAKDGSIMSLDTSADSWGMSAVSRALLQYPYLHAHLSFGGWTNNGSTTAPWFDQLASSPTKMQTFATQAISLMRKTGFDGIDIDWEWWSDYSNGVAPAKKMLAFYQTLRTALDAAAKQDGKAYTLTIAVNGGADRIQAMQDPANPNSVSDFWAQVGKLMDHINIMNYDYHGSWDSTAPAYFQANYDFANTDGYRVGKEEGWSIKAAVNAYVAAGVPAKKLVVGIPLYARTMQVASSSNGGLLQTVTGTGFGDWENGVLDYKCLINPIANPVTGCGTTNPLASLQGLQWYSATSNTTIFNGYGRVALQPWAYSPASGSFVTYDDPWSASEKAKVVKAANLGGTMFWELDGDSTQASTSIVQAVKNTYNQ